MDCADYHKKALRTANNMYLDPGELTLANCALGVAGEAGEFADLIKKTLAQGHTLDKNKAMLELGDVLWHLTIAAERLGYNLNDVAHANINKLQSRYPEKFSTDLSVGREQP